MVSNFIIQEFPALEGKMEQFPKALASTRTLWLSDYLQAAQILGGTKATAMQSLQLHLTGVARSWLNTLPNESIESWGELKNQFIRDFRSTYKRPASLEEVKACMQRKGETLRSYIQ
jgi:hypothetical protein